MKSLEVMKRQLLTVADAVGISCVGVVLGSMLGWGLVVGTGSERRYWNPLTNDADSRKVQVALGIDLFIKHDRAEAVGPGTAVCTARYEEYQGVDGGPAAEKEAAARNAVFEAAVLVASARAERLAAAGDGVA